MGMSADANIFHSIAQLTFFFFIFFYSMQSPAGRHHQERRSAARETNGQRRSQHGSLQLELAQQVITLCVWDI